MSIELKFNFKLISKDNEKIHNKYDRPFLSKKFKDWENLVRAEALSQYSGPILETPLRVAIFAYFSTKVHADCFNLPKGLCDALQGIVYKNDKQIKCGTIIVYESQPRDAFAFLIGEQEEDLK